MVADIAVFPPAFMYMEMVCVDCRKIPSQYNETFEMALTSPPYLNGTNYFRNTKIELWLLDHIETERGLKPLLDKAVCGGINNVNRKRLTDKSFESVEQIATILDKQATDKRIPIMVRQYFADMEEVLSSVYRSLKPNSRFLLDIGDSKFYGVHVPTDRILAIIAQMVGFQIENHNVLARRHSRDKSELVQVELVLRKPGKEI